ncbi:transposase [Hahella sp. KA22]|uniref:transposase n=1 Tax=Hahella sp. KA22 TaxID=1628392 RepID=UPI000FDF061F|nr:transposase [Hahella sp. KA22]AZZ93151.1 transposase [Hahella sp. KA22]QAY56525.1 transposase [Hahella sp. KA22]
MARKTRFNLTGHPQLIMQRGHNRLPCFFDKEDYLYFLECVGKASEQYQCYVHAYVLLKNEFNLLVTPHIENGIPQMMQSLGRRYVQYVNHRYHRSGTLWEGRYKSSLIDSSGYMLTCYRYIDALAVFRGLAPNESEYPWSSYHAHARGEDELGLIRNHPMYTDLGDDAEERQQSFLDLMQYEMEPWIRRHIEQTLLNELVLGGDRFINQIEDLVDRPVRPMKRGRPPKDAAKS